MPELDGDLVLEGPEGRRLHLVAAGRDLALRVEGPPPPAGRATLARTGTLLAQAGLRLEVTDARGRRLALAGRGVRSPLGRLVGAGWHVRPAARALFRRPGRGAPGR
jgi:hypothetical protein